MDRNKEAFEAMKPLCVVLLKEHTLERVMAVARTVADLDPDALQSLQQYILFPLRVMLKDPTKLDLCPLLQSAAGVGEAGVRCMQLVLSRTTVGNWEMFSDLFTALCVMISSKEMCGRASDASEELKLAVVQTLTALLISADADLLIQLYSPKSIAMLGHCVSLLLSLAEHERMRALQVTSVECLNRFVPADEQSHAVVYRAASRAFASFLPGLSVALSRVITGDQKQGQAVTVSAIECWARHVAMVMDDGLLAPTKEAAPQRDAATKPASDKGPQSLLVEKTETWVRDSAAKLDMLIGKIVAMVTSRSWKVRMALVSFAERLITTTKSSMACCTSKLLEVLVSLSQDSYDQIASKSLTVLRSLAKKPLTAESRLLSELLEDGMHRLVTTLPRIIRTADDETKFSTINVMTGYIKLLGHRLNCLLYSAPHLKRLSVALIQVLELDIRDVSILETRSLPAVSDSADLSAPDGGFNNHLLRTFKHFSDFRIYQQITHLCQLMGQYGNVSLLVDNFLSYFQESPSHAHQAVMIISEIMRGTLLSAAEDHGNFSIWDGDKGATEEEEVKEEKEKEEVDIGRNVAELQCICRMLLDEYQSPSYWDLPTSVSQSHSQTSSPRQHLDHAHLMMMPLTSSDSLTVAEMNRNTVLKCLLLEGIAVLAQVLGPQFNLMLMHCIYPVLERLADDRSVICQSAHSTLLSLSQSCGYRCIAELLYENVDYLTDSVSSRLRHYEWNLKAPLVLKVTLRYSNPDIMPLLQDTIDEVLHILDSYHGDHASSLMSVLQALVQAIKRWFPVENSVEELQTVESSHADPVDDIRAFLQDYVEKLNIADGEVMDCDVDLDQGDVEGEGQETSPDNIEEPKELPLHISNTKKVLERCVHLLSSSNPRLRLSVLSTVRSAVEVLAANQDVLLPLVHKLWPAFVRRFSDPEVLVINKAFETLLTLAETSRDFIRRRTVKDVWPKLIKLLEAHAETSSKAGSSYHHTAYYKLQHSILSGIGQLCIQVDIAENELLSMVQACVPYLHTGQPQGLQEACLASFECFIQADPDAVWFTLQEIYCPSPLQPPHTCFPEIKFAGESVQKKEDWVNVQKLLR